MKRKNILLSWIGHTDLRAMAQDSSVKIKQAVEEAVGPISSKSKIELGPVKTLTKQVEFDQVFLLSEFISDNTLNSNQMEFVNMVVDHVVSNGFLDKSSLNNDPFDRYGDLVTLFDGKIDRVKGIVNLIDKISGRFSVAS